MYMSHVTCHQRQQTQPKTLPMLLTPSLVPFPYSSSLLMFFLHLICYFVPPFFHLFLLSSKVFRVLLIFSWDIL